MNTQTLTLLLFTTLTFVACTSEPDEAKEASWRSLELEDVDESAELVDNDLTGKKLASEFARRLGAALRSPFPGNTESRLYNCPADPSAQSCTSDAQCKASNRLNECYIPSNATSGKCGHHRPWNGDWSIDLFAADGDTCGEAAYLRLSPSALPGGLPPDSLRVQPGAPTPACSSGDLGKGGYDQTFTVYARYANQEYVLGSVLVAHLDHPKFNGATVSDLDPANLHIGEVWQPDGELCNHADPTSCLADHGCAWKEGQPGTCYNPCWSGCHLHLELFNATANTASCWQNMCDDAGLFNPPAWGEESVIGFVGGSDEGDMCPRFVDSESTACGTWDHDLAGCNAHGFGTTQDCAYYVTTDKCRARGTSNCQAGINTHCAGTETGPCSEFDGNVTACDAHGISDPVPGNDTQDCAYYFLSGRCMARGSSNCVADCDNCVGAGCDQCSQAYCPSTEPQL